LLQLLWFWFCFFAVAFGLIEPCVQQVRQITRLFVLKFRENSYRWNFAMEKNLIRYGKIAQNQSSRLDMLLLSIQE
jgi:hypothetical protein